MAPDLLGGGSGRAPKPGWPLRQRAYRGGYHPQMDDQGEAPGPGPQPPAPADGDEWAPAPGRPPVSRAAAFLAFLAVVLGGLSGAAIGFGLVGIECQGDCGTPEGAGALLGGLLGAGGVAVVAVLVLRAMAEWKAGGIRRG